MNSYIPLILFWCFSIIIVCLDLKWSVFAYLLIVQIDFTSLLGAPSVSTSSIGVENTFKVIILPAILFWRMGLLRIRRPRYPLIAKLWISLMIYAVVSATWSDYRLSALKMVGYLCSYAILLLVFSAVWSRGWITERFLVFMAWSAIAMAVIQTYLLGNTFGIGQGITTYSSRFTTFSDAQGFAAFLVSILALLLCGGSSKHSTQAVEVALVCCIVLTGSRYVFSATLCLFLVTSILKSMRRTGKFDRMKIFKGATVGALVALLLVVLVARYFPGNRIDELISFAEEQNPSVEDLGTFAWRLLVYEEAISQLANRNLFRLAIGSGTSSAGDVLLGLNYQQYAPTLDPNRSMHNEFLRSLYEWGFIGTSLLIFFLVELAKISFRMFKVRHSWQAMAVLGMLPAIVMSLTVENILANSGGPGGTGYVLVIAALFSSLRESARQSGRKELDHVPCST